MKLLEKDDAGSLWMLSSRERGLLITLFTHPMAPRQPARMSRNSEALEELCQADLAGELEDHGQQIRARLVEVVVDAEEADSADDEGHEWVMSLTQEDGEAFLQALNELRLRAWEQLGKPNPPEVPEDLSEDSPDVLPWWTLGIASRFQSKILSAIDPE